MSMYALWLYDTITGNSYLSTSDDQDFVGIESRFDGYGGPVKPSSKRSTLNPNKILVVAIYPPAPVRCYTLLEKKKDRIQ